MGQIRKNDETCAKAIALRVSEAGGRAYYVGGCVRDRLLGIGVKDVDIEVHGLAPDVLRALLDAFGPVRTVGKAFGIYTLDRYGLDIAMPRKERATGRGHRDFEVFVDPYIGPAEAARRRDFTVNAMMEDVLSGEILDFYGGRQDLADGVLRCVDERFFADDALRVLRAAQFAARFGFAVEEKTLRLCSDIDLTALSKERVEGELKKALLQSPRPSVFFEVLAQMGQLAPWFAELLPLRGLAQDAIYHPEGDVWVHTMQVIDRAAGLRERAQRPYAFMLLALCHDLGKAVTTEEIDGRIHAYGHETAGVPIAEALLRRITGERETIAYVKNMIPLHMRPNRAAFAKSSVKSTNRLFDEAASPADLVLMALSDHPVMAGESCFTGDEDFLRERLRLYEETMAAPHVTGKDLLAAGLAPGKVYTKALQHAHKLRLAGVSKDDALRQTLGYVRSLREERSKT